jgi:hypothetical protein
MKKSPILAFESSAFLPVPGEDEATNPGIFGKALAQWLGTQLHLSGVAAGEIVPEDRLLSVFLDDATTQIVRRYALS